jgi:G protein-coupled receptor Mth (Methuselah protein)
MLASVPFLVLTLLVYALIKELRSLHGKCLMSYCFGLILLYLSLSLTQLQIESLHRIEWLCKTTGYVTYASVLICFLWLNVMCHDIYSTFR